MERRKRSKILIRVTCTCACEANHEVLSPVERIQPTARLKFATEDGKELIYKLPKYGHASPLIDVLPQDSP